MFDLSVFLSNSSNTATCIPVIVFFCVEPFLITLTALKAGCSSNHLPELYVRHNNDLKIKFIFARIQIKIQ